MGDTAARLNREQAGGAKFAGSTTIYTGKEYEQKTGFGKRINTSDSLEVKWGITSAFQLFLSI